MLGEGTAPGATCDTAPGERTVGPVIVRGMVGTRGPGPTTPGSPGRVATGGVILLGGVARHVVGGVVRAEIGGVARGFAGGVALEGVVGAPGAPREATTEAAWVVIGGVALEMGGVARDVFGGVLRLGVGVVVRDGFKGALTGFGWGARDAPCRLGRTVFGGTRCDDGLIPTMTKEDTTDGEYCGTRVRRRMSLDLSLNLLAFESQIS
ncbi:hypothetical protein E2C01_001280 [Portunus trituberculatus]|uniref:Uncharacterized protein n=1 Tax=Portunus trituberculatus TaxID=210409 RepID=A0A5B7CHK4_PORTR|nr:hypothetical protein [Portunus trituberculatus]